MDVHAGMNGSTDTAPSCASELAISGNPVQPHSILIGRETLLVACAETLMSRGHDIAAVVARDGPAAEWARQKSLRLFATPSDLLAVDLGDVDYLFSITNLSVLPQALLDLAKRGAINFHDGPLPAYAGLNTPAWALMADEPTHGVTWHCMTSAVDAGAVVAAESFGIDVAETAVSLNTKCFEAGLRSFAALTADLDLSIGRARAQASGPQRLFGRKDRPEAAALIDWRLPAARIAHIVRALNFGTYNNPLGMPKAMLDGTAVAIHQVEEVCASSGLEPGRIVSVKPDMVVATGKGDLRLVRLSDLDGNEIEGLAANPGDRFDPIEDETRAAIGLLDSSVARYENWWRRRFADRDPLQLPHFRATAGVSSEREWFDRPLSSTLSRHALLSALIAYLGRVAGRDDVWIGYSDPIHAARQEGCEEWLATELPLRANIDWTGPLVRLEDQVAQDVSDLHKHVGICRDLIGRCPELRGKVRLDHPVAIQIVSALDEAAPATGNILHFALGQNGEFCRISVLSGVLSAAEADDIWAGFAAMLASLEDSAGSIALARLPVLTSEERARVIGEWNDTATPMPVAKAMHDLFVSQVRRTPDKPAITCLGETLTYAEVDARSNQLARRFSAMGIGPDGLVGINLERSVDMVVALLAVHKAGGAYVPLDPAYPRDRLAHMIADSGLSVIVTQSALIGDLPETSATILCIDDEREAIASLSEAPFDSPALGHNLAYVIYTSGSTGLPKGVMVEHRNVLNFFAGMDRKLESDGVWLAVTSLSFDISVLELCWPLTRGYHVVIATEREVRGDVSDSTQTRSVGFSLFYFASGDGCDQYRLLLEGARFADTHGFQAVWTPERHFHAFGGPYPNPSVMSAAIAAVTSRVAIRAGSVVAPLHNPARIAEEWAVVDNLSGGRVGIAFASGWQPNDFVLNPPAFADRSGSLHRCIDDVRGLWRGESRSFPGPLGDVEIATFPRPVQSELPFWITTAGNVDSFAAAGRAGGGVLTHLLGQSVEELAEKIGVYRAARREAGYPGDGHVTLMLHSYLGEDREQVRAQVRQPLIDYLRTSTSLLKQYAWSFPAFKRAPGVSVTDDVNLGDLSAEDTDALLDHAFDRYFETSGLFGPVADCMVMVDRLRAIGVDEIGCLIDFGVPTDAVLKSLPLIDRLKSIVNRPDKSRETSLASLMERHGVTHLQCTPSLAQMLASDALSRVQLGRLKRMMVGGEAFPPLLARDLTALISGSIMNMYGPTETTIWSAVHTLDTNGEAPPLGRPLANQKIYILDRHMQPVRPGTPGELVIAGDGVVRGYHERAELTAERFVADPFHPGRRAYRTGDLARHRSDGVLEFLGRLDHQVKIRGYRIELGEIEVAIAGYPGVSEAVVVPNGEGAAMRLIAYFTATAEAPVDGLRDHLRASLPEFMVPAHYMCLPSLPRTPNGKTDRKALPFLDTTVHAAAEARVEPATPMEEQILALWRDLLQLPNVGPKQNFFDLGGHSLLAVQMHRRLSVLIDRPVALTDIFRFPTVASLSTYLSTPAGRSEAAQEGQERALNRRAALQRRSSARMLARN